METQKYDTELERICEHDKKDRSTWAWRQKKPEEALIPVLTKILSDYSKRQTTADIAADVDEGGVSLSDAGGVFDDMAGEGGNSHDDLEDETADERRERLATERKEKRLKAAEAKAAAAAAAAIGISAAAVQEAAKSEAMVCVC